jgi:hypothetical protein
VDKEKEEMRERRDKREEKRDRKREKEIDDRSAALRKKRVAKMRRLVCGNMRVS